MARVLLINPSYAASYGGSKASLVNPVFPTMGLATLAAMAMQRGHHVEIFDLSYVPYDYAVIEKRIREFKPDIIGATATTPFMNQVRDISVLAKDISQDIRVVAGGPHLSALPVESLLESKLDAVFVGEADYSFADYCDGKNPADIGSLYYRDGDTIRSTPMLPPIANLDELPMPAWELYDPKVYRKYSSHLYSRKPPQAGIEFSRGCVYKCDFCASKMTMALGYRKKSPQRCADEMKKLYALGYREAMVVDDIFTSDQQWAVEVCDAIIASGVKMAWTCSNGIRVESANDALFSKMRKAGCYRVSFGFESGNDDVLKAFGKGGKACIEQGKRAVKLARKAGIDSNGFFMLGLSSDTEATMQDTIDFACQLPLDMMKFGRTIAFPGTEMFQKYHKLGIIKSYNWDDYFMYSSEQLFAHPQLSEETIQDYIAQGYRKAVLFNPGFIWRRFMHGLRTGHFFLDAYYALKFYLLPSLSERTESRYYAPEKWPVYDFTGKDFSRVDYQVVKKTPTRKTSPIQAAQLIPVQQH